MIAQRAGRSVVLLGFALLCACSTPVQTRALLEEAHASPDSSVLLEKLPFFPQQRYQCGPAALATMLAASGLAVSAEELRPEVFVPARRGAFQLEMVAAARARGRLVYPLPPTLAAVFRELRAGHPVLVLQNLGLSWFPQWHFAVVKGYDLEAATVILNSGVRENYSQPLSVFERTWGRGGYWAVLVLEPGQLPAADDPDALFQALVALEHNDPAAALAAYPAATKRWPDHAGLLMGQGNLLYAHGRPEQAEIRFRRVIARHPGLAPAYNNLAQLRLEQGDRAEAEALAARAVELGGEFSPLYERTLKAIRSSKHGHAEERAR